MMNNLSFCFYIYDIKPIFYISYIIILNIFLKIYNEVLFYFDFYICLIIKI